MSDAEAPPSARTHLTLGLCTILHAFTHAYGVMLVPLYLLIVADLKLSGVGQASLLVTVYGVVYGLGSLAAGALADRSNQKRLLGVGQIGNAAAIMLMGFTRQYEVLLLLAVVAGISGTLFHPAANALSSGLYPKSPGMAIGVLGMGAGLGFFVGPQYAGWRAESAAWNWGTVAGWQRPAAELGALGMLFGVLFLIVAKGNRRAVIAPRGNEARGPSGAAAAAHPPLSRELRRKVVAIALALSWRDFAGIASITLASVYLQKAHGFDAKRTGFTLGAMMLIAVVINPLAVWLSPGRRRLPALAAVLVAGGAVMATLPYWRAAAILPVLCVFQACNLGSYAISDAAMLERIAPEVRGRVVGLFLLLAWTFSSTAPWVMGYWTDAMGGRAREPLAYVVPFTLIGAMLAGSAFATLLIRRLGDPPAGRGFDPMMEVTPSTLEPVG